MAARPWSLATSQWKWASGIKGRGGERSEAAHEAPRWRFLKALRCGAHNRRGLPCQWPAMRLRRRCRLHGGKSTYAKTAAGCARCRQAVTKHGFTRAVKEHRRRAPQTQRQLREALAQCQARLTAGRTSSQATPSLQDRSSRRCARGQLTVRPDDENTVGLRSRSPAHPPDERRGVLNARVLGLRRCLNRSQYCYTLCVRPCDLLSLITHEKCVSISYCRVTHGVVNGDTSCSGGNPSSRGVWTAKLVFTKLRSRSLITHSFRTCSQRTIDQAAFTLSRNRPYKPARDDSDPPPGHLLPTSIEVIPSELFARPARGAGSVATHPCDVPARDWRICEYFARSPDGSALARAHDIAWCHSRCKSGWQGIS